MDDHKPTYRESLRIGWALFWRMITAFLLLMFAANGLLLFLLPELTRTGPPLWVALLPLFVAGIICAFGLMPYFVRTVLGASFPGFRVRLIRSRFNQHNSVDQS
jgi:hypothetical protein